MPSENTEKFDSAPPVNRSSMVMDTPPLSANALANSLNGMPGTGTYAPKRYSARIAQREEDLLAQLRNLEGIDDRA